jgi:hypothetical protein
MRAERNLVPAVPLSELSGSSLRVPDPLQSSFAPTPARSLSGSGGLPGFRPSSRHHRARPLDSRAPKSSIRSVRRCSQPLDGFLRAPAPQACFIPQPRPGNSARSGVTFSAQPPDPHRNRACPLAVVRRPLARTSLAATAGALGFEALIRAELARDGSVVSLPDVHAPLRVSSPPGPLFPTVASVYSRTSAPEVTRANLRPNSRPCAGLPRTSSSVFSAGNSTRASPNESPCPRILNLRSTQLLFQKSLAKLSSEELRGP